MANSSKANTERTPMKETLFNKGTIPHQQKSTCRRHCCMIFPENDACNTYFFKHVGNG
jgi:hypothetical protein